jgi:hypothetical protein
MSVLYYVSTKTKLYEKTSQKIMQSILIEQGTTALYVHTTMAHLDMYNHLSSEGQLLHEER